MATQSWYNSSVLAVVAPLTGGILGGVVDTEESAVMRVVPLVGLPCDPAAPHHPDLASFLQTSCFLTYSGGAVHVNARVCGGVQLTLDSVTKYASNVAGAVACGAQVVAGAAITVSSLGVAAPLGAAMVSGGASGVMYFVATPPEKLSGEQFCKEQAKAMATGALTGGIGSFVSGAGLLVKLGSHTLLSVAGKLTGDVVAAVLNDYVVLVAMFAPTELDVPRGDGAPQSIVFLFKVDGKVTYSVWQNKELQGSLGVIQRADVGNDAAVMDRLHTLVSTRPLVTAVPDDLKEVVLRVTTKRNHTQPCSMRQVYDTTTTANLAVAAATGAVSSVAGAGVEKFGRGLGDKAGEVLGKKVSDATVQVVGGSVSGATTGAVGQAVANKAQKKPLLNGVLRASVEGAAVGAGIGAANASVKPVKGPTAPGKASKKPDAPAPKDAAVPAANPDAAPAPQGPRKMDLGFAEVTMGDATTTSGLQTSKPPGLPKWAKFGSRAGSFPSAPDTQDLLSQLGPAGPSVPEYTSTRTTPMKVQLKNPFTGTVYGEAQFDHVVKVEKPLFGTGPAKSTASLNGIGITGGDGKPILPKMPASSGVTLLRQQERVHVNTPLSHDDLLRAINRRQYERTHPPQPPPVPLNVEAAVAAEVNSGPPEAFGAQRMATPQQQQLLQTAAELNPTFRGAYFYLLADQRAYYTGGERETVEGGAGGREWRQGEDFAFASVDEIPLNAVSHAAFCCV